MSYPEPMVLYHQPDPYDQKMSWKKSVFCNFAHLVQALLWYVITVIGPRFRHERIIMQDSMSQYR